MKLLNPNDYSADVVALNPGLFKQKTATPQAKQKRPDSDLEAKFLYYWQMSGGPELERDYVGWTNRKLEIDFYHPGSKVGIEVNGGIGQLSGHTSWNGIHRDYEKLMLATQAGIKLVFLGTRHLNDDEALVWISMIIMMTK